MQLGRVLWLSKPHVQDGLQIPSESGYQSSVFTAILFPAGKQYDVRINQNTNTTVYTQHKHTQLINNTTNAFGIYPRFQQKRLPCT